MISVPPPLPESGLRQLLREFDRTFAEVCAAIPQPNSFDIVGTEKSPWKVLVNEKGVVTIESQYVPPDREADVIGDLRRTLLTLFDPEKAGYGAFVKHLSHECLEGWLPVSRVRFATPLFPEVELRVFVDETDSLQLCVKTPGERRFFTVPLPELMPPGELLRHPDPVPTAADGRSFADGLERLRTHWSKKFASLLAWDFPHAFLKKGILAGLTKSLITQYDGALRYGATRYYCDEGKSAESFPPTVLTFCEGALFYGLEEEALRFLGRFIRDFVSEDGAILHRDNGAALSEHGMLLALFARCRGQLDAPGFFAEHGPAAEAVARRLFRLTEKAGEKLVAGCPEDDLRNAPARQWFSANLWIARGLLEYAKTFPGVLPEEKIKTFAAKVVRSCQESAIPCGDGLVFIPPCPEYREPFADMNAFLEVAPGDDIHSLASYTNYRIYPEMLSTTLLPAETAREIVNFRRARGGDFNGATAFRIFRDFPPLARCLDDWPLHNMLKGLAHYGEYGEFVRLLAGHMALHQSRGTFFAPEMSFRDRLDSTFCTPSQMTVPLGVRYLFDGQPSIARTEVFQGEDRI